MAVLTIDPLAITTFQHVSGVRAFIDLLDGSLPEVELRQRQTLERQAKEEGWEFGEYSVETQVLDERFGHWMPRLAAYSVVMLLQSIVETQLFACAERVAHDKSPVFSPRDLLAGRGSTVQVAPLYLRKAGGIDVTKDAAWSTLMDLKNLRDIIIHRSGTRGETVDQHKTFDHLIERYKPRLSLAEQASWLYGEIFVSLVVCRDFLEQVGSFFGRTFTAIGVDEHTIPREYRPHA